MGTSENFENGLSGLKLEDLARHPMPGLVFPSSVKFSPGWAVGYLSFQPGRQPEKQSSGTQFKKR